MPLLQFAAVSILAYLGLAAGFFLAKYTREELPTGNKYFPWLQKLIILIAAAIAMNFLHFSLAIRVAVYLALLLIIAIKIILPLFYALFGLAVFAVSKNQDLLLAMLSLVFLFGMVSGSLSFVKKDFTRNLLLLLARNSVYLTSILLYAFYR